MRNFIDNANICRDRKENSGDGIKGVVSHFSYLLALLTVQGHVSKIKNQSPSAFLETPQVRDELILLDKLHLIEHVHLL